MERENGLREALLTRALALNMVICSSPSLSVNTAKKVFLQLVVKVVR